MGCAGGRLRVRGERRGERARGGGRCRCSGGRLCEGPARLGGAARRSRGAAKGEQDRSAVRGRGRWREAEGCALDHCAPACIGVGCGHGLSVISGARNDSGSVWHAPEHGPSFASSDVRLREWGRRVRTGHMGNKVDRAHRWHTLGTCMEVRRRQRLLEHFPQVVGPLREGRFCLSTTAELLPREQPPLRTLVTNLLSGPGPGREAIPSTTEVVRTSELRPALLAPDATPRARLSPEHLHH